MKNVQGLQLKTGSREELLPEFMPDFPYIATCAELDKYHSSVVPWHWHRAAELFYMESGSLEYITPGGRWVFPAGSGGFVNSNVLHSTKIQRTSAQNFQFLHLFDPSLISGELGSRIAQKYVLPLSSAPGIELIPLYPDDPAQAELLRHIRQAFTLSEQEWGYELKLRESLTQIWLMLLEIAKPELETGRRAGHSTGQIKLMMTYIHEHYHQPICIDELAKAAFISKRACFRLFQENLHMTPLEYLRAYRLQIACRMLAEGNAPITEIAGQCALGSGSYFSKIFREEFGYTPLEYRRHWHDRDDFWRK